MCGIAGYFGLKREGGADFDAKSAVGAMNAVQKRRGPDFAGIWEDRREGEDGRRCVLGHTRLAIIDLNERSNQPMVGARWAITYNGEIFNFRAVRNELEEVGVKFQTSGDTELLLKAIEHWGLEEAVGRMAGMFAFAAYDRDTGAIHLVRDRLGIKPLYFCERNGALYFASSPAAIVHGVGADAGWNLNWDSLYSYFLLGATSGPDSLFEGVAKVDAAEMITFGADSAPRRKHYWEPRPRGGDLMEVLETVVEEHREADVPSAIFLSGGVDSSVLSVLLKRLACFHLRSEETEMARHVAEQVNSELEICEPIEDVDYEEILEDYARFSGAPSASSPIPYLVARQIRESGYTVAFSANGADELFHGYPRTPSPELSQGFRVHNGYEAASYGCLADQLRSIFRSPENFYIPRAEETGVKFIDLADSIERRFKLDDFPKSASHRWLELQTYVLQDLNPTLDFSSMAHSVEVRVPFLDHRLVEVALTAEANQHITTGYGRKSPLKAALDRNGVHPMVWARKKLGFSLNPDALRMLKTRRLEALGELREEGILSVDPLCGEAVRDIAYLGAAAQAFLAWKRVWIDSGIVSL